MSYTPLVVGLVVALIACLLVYLDARLFDTPKTKVDYFKAALLSGGLSAAVVYFMGENSPLINIATAASAEASQMAQVGGAGGLATIQGQEILTGAPPF
mgnify:CR=1 FL=1